MSFLRSVLACLGLAALGFAACYSLLTYAAVVYWRVRKTALKLTKPGRAVSILKPLCGAEPGLYDNLRSFCRQDFSPFEVIFGVCDAGDLALPVVARLMAEFPDLPLSVVIHSSKQGGNRKVNSLIKMVASARHEVLVIADSDARVEEDYLAAIIAPLADPQVGLVTSIYRGTPTPGIWSKLGAMYVNEWYVPSVLLAWLLGHRGYVSGQTICLTRETLESVGGFAALANHLADDYKLGEMVRGTGKTVVLSTYVPQAEHHESTFGGMMLHEGRWMRTIKVLKPSSFRLLFLSFSLPVSLVGIVLAAPFSVHKNIVWSLFTLATAARLLLHLACRKEAKSRLAELWLIPIRDLLILWVWVRTFRASPITWRGAEFRVDRYGIMRPLS